MLLATLFLTIGLLLQTTVSPADTRFSDWAIRLIPIGISLYVLFSGRSREERKALDKNITDLLLAKQKQEERMTGMQLQHERAMESVQARLREHDQKLDGVGQLREEMASVRTELKHMNEGWRDIVNKLDRLLERSNR